MLLYPHYHYLDLVTCFWLDFYNSPCLLSQASVFTLHKIIWNTFPKWKSVTFFPCPKSADNSLLSTEKKSKRITGFQHSFGPNPTSLILGHWDWCPFFYDQFTLPVVSWMWLALSCLYIVVQAVPSARYVYYFSLVIFFSIKVQLNNRFLYKSPQRDNSWIYQTVL